MDHLETNSYITHIEPLLLSEETLSQFGPKTRERISEENAHINAYSMSYKSQGHTVRGFIVEPKEGTNMPCIIMNRGGAKEFGIWTDKMVFNFMGYFAAKGYIVVASQFSGCAGSEGKDEIGGSELEDILVFRELLREHPRADYTRIGMDGASRGGMMAYLALAKVDWLKAVVVHAAPSNIIRQYELRQSLKAFHSDAFDVNNEEELKKRSAVFWPEKFCKTTPLLISHGTRDNRVSALDSLELAAKLYENQVPFRLAIYEGADHYLSEFKEEGRDAIEKWFARFLKNGESLPALALEVIT